MQRPSEGDVPDHQEGRLKNWPRITFLQRSQLSRSSTAVFEFQLGSMISSKLLKTLLLEEHRFERQCSGGHIFHNKAGQWCNYLYADHKMITITITIIAMQIKK